MEEKRLALIGIIIEDVENIDFMNSILHDFAEYIVGRMGLPVRERGVSIISIAIDAPLNQINALSGKLGALKGITTKTIYSAV